MSTSGDVASSVVSAKARGSPHAAAAFSVLAWLLFATPTISKRSQRRKVCTRSPAPLRLKTDDTNTRTCFSHSHCSLGLRSVTPVCGRRRARRSGTPRPQPRKVRSTRTSEDARGHVGSLVSFSPSSRRSALPAAHAMSGSWDRRRPRRRPGPRTGTVDLRRRRHRLTGHAHLRPSRRSGSVRNAATSRRERQGHAPYVTRSGRYGSASSNNDPGAPDRGAYGEKQSCPCCPGTVPQRDGGFGGRAPKSDTRRFPGTSPLPGDVTSVPRGSWPRSA